MPMVVGITEYPQWLGKEAGECGPHLNIFIAGISKNHIC